jgi:transposase-like protein
MKSINEVKMPVCPMCKAFQTIINDNNPSFDCIGYECCVCGYTWEMEK